MLIWHNSLNSMSKSHNAAKIWEIKGVYMVVNNFCESIFLLYVGKKV